MPDQHDVFSKPRLLNIPIKRAAWSDRTALLMAEMSMLAYYKFELDANGGKIAQENLDEVLERLLAPDNELEADISTDAEDADEFPGLSEDAVKLRDDLAKAGFKLEGLFNDIKADTQAFLAISDSGSSVRPFGNEEVVILSFRGTDSIRVKDWITNAKVNLIDVDGTDIHSGFQGAFDRVRPVIEKKLNPLIIQERRTLYLTGHSLGGALALIATREIGPESHGATYTFGSPRVGRFGFSRDIKTPMYRVVNANDLVPRLPPAYLQTILAFVLRVLNVPAFGLLNSLIEKFSRYVHYGDMRFLRRTKRSDYSDVQVLSNPSVIYRFFWYWPALLANWKSPIKNHAINLYCKKLAAYAKSRN